MRLHGSAVATIVDIERHAAVTLDLELNQWELRYVRADPPHPLELPLAVTMGARPLRDVRLSTPFGELTLPTYDDYFVLEHVPDCRDRDPFSQYVVGLFDGSLPVTLHILKPRKSLIEFDLHATVDHKNEPECEVSWQVGSRCHPFEQDAMLFSRPIRLSSDGTHVRARSAGLSPQELNALRLAVGLGFGGPASMRSLRTEGKLSINAAPHGDSATNPLWIDSTDAATSIVRLAELLHMAQAGTAHHLERAARYNALAKRNSGLMEERMVAQFTALELIDGSKTLTKQSVSKVLEIGIHEAEAFVRLRNAMLHSGSSLSEGCHSVALDLASANGAFVAPTWLVHPSTAYRRAFYRLAGLMNGFWARSIGLRGFQDYSAYWNA